MSALKNHPKINTAIKFINAGLQLFGNNFALFSNMRFIVMFVTAVCVFFLINLRWPKKKNIYENSATRLVCKTRKFDHVSPTLVELHWFPIKHRIVFKILLLVYKSPA